MHFVKQCFFEKLFIHNISDFHVSIFRNVSKNSTFS